MSGHVPYPLEWPVGKRREKARTRSQFSDLAFGNMFRPCELPSTTRRDLAEKAGAK